MDNHVLKKFVSGALSGAGFSIAALCVYTLWFLYVLPPLVDQRFSSAGVVTEHASRSQRPEYTPDFHDLSVDEKIEKASAIMVISFEVGKGGHYKSIVEDVVKQVEGVELHYRVGEVYEENSHFKLSDDFVPKRAVVFMQGNPARMRYSTTFDGDRINGLGGISLALLREKCSDS